MSYVDPNQQSDINYAEYQAQTARRRAVKAASEAALQGDPLAAFRLREAYRGWVDMAHDVAVVEDDDDDYGVIGNL